VSERQRYQVVAGIFYKDGRVLMGKRHDREGRFAGYWEFPGGKIETGESDQEALVREFREELYCAVDRTKHFRTLTWEYPDREIELRFYMVELSELDLTRDDFEAHSEFAWYALPEARAQQVLPANQKILEALEEIAERLPFSF
jgi:8-oxo-dGTP diphosphatase